MRSVCLVALLTVLSPCETPQEAPAVTAPAAEMSFERTPERLARGKYLFEAVALCVVCHSEVEEDVRPRRTVPGRVGVGRIFPANGRRNYDVVVPNITSDVETGAGGWTDQQLARAIRQGIGHDGRTLVPIMPYLYFHAMSDEDLASVIVFVRSLPPVHNELPKTVLPEEVAAKLEPLPPISGVPAPNPADRVACGSYLVKMAHCEVCHTPQRNGKPIPELAFSGGRLFPTSSGENLASGNLTVASANLTPDPSGIPYYDEELFIQTIRAGAVGGVRELDTIMPWSQLAAMTDEDLASVLAFLRSLEPVRHQVSNQEPPTYCPLCGGMHGLGELNRAPTSSDSTAR